MVFQLVTTVAGQVDQHPRRVKLLTSATLDEVLAAGYLNSGNLGENQIYITDIFDVVYLYNNVAHSGTYAEFVPNISGGVITLSLQVSEGNVLLPVVSGDIATFNGTTGQVQDSGIPANTVLVNNGNNVMATGSKISLAKGTGTSTGGVVTINQQSGVITTPSLTTGASQTYTITLTNSFITANSVLLASFAGGTNTTLNLNIEAIPGSGVATILINNLNATTALDGTVIINFAVF